MNELLLVGGGATAGDGCVCFSAHKFATPTGTCAGPQFWTGPTGRHRRTDVDHNNTVPFEGA